MSFDWPKMECNDNVNDLSQNVRLTEKQAFLHNMLQQGIEIASEEEFRQVAELLQKESVFDLSNVDYKTMVKDQVSISLQMNQQKSWLSVFPLKSMFNANPQWPFHQGWVIENWWEFQQDLSRNISYMRSEDNKFQEILSKYESYQSSVKEQCQNELWTLRNDFESFVFPVMNTDDIKITYTSPLDADNKDIDNIDTSYTVKQGDTIWWILQSEQYGFTESQANTLLKVLEKDSDFVNSLKSGNIHKIYPGEKIVFPKNLWEMIHQSNQHEEEKVSENVYEVQNGDTPGKIIFDNYSWVDWKNMKEVMSGLWIWDIIKVGQKITLKDSIELHDGPQITKKTK